MVQSSLDHFAELQLTRPTRRPMQNYSTANISSNVCAGSELRRYNAPHKYQESSVSVLALRRHVPLAPNEAFLLRNLKRDIGMTSLWVSMRSACLVVAVGLGAILSHGFVLHGRFNGMSRLQSRDRLFAVSSEEDTQQQAKGMPSVSEFSAYYKNVVKDGAEMRLDQIMAYTSVSKLLNKGTVMAEDLNNLWISAVGDASGLNEQEGYELICMINDLPDPEDEDFYDKEFAKLVGDEAGAKLPFFKFMNWGDVQDMMNEGVLSMEEVTEIWRGNAGDLNSSIDRTTFGKINLALDDAIETKELAEEEDGAEVSSTVTTTAVSDDDDTVDISDVDVWSPEFDPTSVFDPESLEEITSFFAKAAGGVDKTMTFAGFQAWEDVQELLNEKTMTPVILQKTWEEACKGSETIDYETFLRLNVRMDLLMDELEASAATPAAVDQSDSSSSSSSSSRGSESGAVKEEDDAEQFYRSEFQQLSGGGALVRLDMLLEWKEVKELIDDGAVTQKQVERMFEGMPKEPMGIPANTFGISEDTFVAFNGMLDVVLDASGGEGGGTVNTPSVLVSEPARPMPSQSELKLGDLTTDEEEAANTGLSAGDLELMKTLDKADNMLNSGDFGDFDKLIDDLDDPRLAALRVQEQGAEDVMGGLGEGLGELVAMFKDEQK